MFLFRSDRDYVNLVHWKDRDGVTMASVTAATHPDRPETKGLVRCVVISHVTVW